MAKVKLNPILEQLRGQVGDLVFKRYGEGTIITRKPDAEGREWSEAQLTHRERFRQAALYGKMVLADPETKAIYEQAAQTRSKNLFSLTIADFFNAPTIDEIDLSGYTGAQGDTITIRAHDDLDVMAVHVEIADSDGNSIESGDAVQSSQDAIAWVYTSTSTIGTGTTVRIGVTATDRPGQSVQAEDEATL